MKKKQMEKKKRKDVRTRDWADKHEYSFTHDLVRHRRAALNLPDHPQDPDSLPAEVIPNATVISHAKKWATVFLDGKERLCTVDERLKEQGATLFAPGDEVWVEVEGDEAIIRGVAPRRTRLSRPSIGRDGSDEQVFAANVDLLMVMAAAAQPAFKTGLVDRFLIAAEVGGVEPILCVNKMDLVDAEPAEVGLYRELGVKVFLLSCKTREGVEAFRAVIAGKTSVLSGHSGVGKSSLLNALDPNIDALTLEVSEKTDRGRHATTGARLYQLPGNTRIIDTPGIRALGLWSVSSQELSYYFPELAELSQGCHFRNCTHVHEPKCAVREAVSEGRVSRPRYESYLRIRASLESETKVSPGRLRREPLQYDL
jgi:ribosome biogenesis GTPase